jgi:hypothetical protein
VACGSRSQLDAPKVAADAAACNPRAPAHACEKLRVIGPSALPAGPAFLIARADGFDAVGYPDGPSQRFVQHVVVGTSDLVLDAEHTFFDANWGPKFGAAAGDRVAILDFVSDAEDYTHAHFRVYDASYVLRSDVEIDDGHHQCDWRALTCDDARCFATCWGDDGPRFVTFDVASGTVLSGPDDDGFAFQGGPGSTVPLDCGDAMTFAVNETAMFARIETQIFEVDDGPYAYEYEPELPIVWPYDWKSVVWWSNGWTLKRIDRDANVTIIGVDALTQDEVFDTIGATNIGLVRAGAIATSKDAETASTDFHAHVIRPDGSITNDVVFETEGYVTQASSAPIAMGLALAWTEQRAGMGNTAKAAVIECADP